MKIAMSMLKIQLEFSKVIILKKGDKMNESIIKTCQYCGESDFTTGYSFGYGNIFIKNYLLGKRVEYTICSKCGSIVYARIPSLLKKQ